MCSAQLTNANANEQTTGHDQGEKEEHPSTAEDDEIKEEEAEHADRKHNGLAFTYQSDFDKNGLIYALATDHGQLMPQNPVDMHKVAVQCSGLHSDSQPLATLLDRADNGDCIIFDDKDSAPWLSVRFVDLAVRPSHYC